jgi:hypothetical protein
MAGSTFDLQNSDYNYTDIKRRDTINNLMDKIMSENYEEYYGRPIMEEITEERETLNETVMMLDEDPEAS